MSIVNDHRIQEIDSLTFRRVMEAEVNNANSHLTLWLKEDSFTPKQHNYKPCTKEGRAYIDFYHTLSYVLQWYKLWKIVRFKEFGWKIDKDIVKNIHVKFSSLIEHALATREKGEFHDYFKNYDPQIISYYTATDYKFQNITGAEIHNVLDFGSGIGRQAFQWCTQEKINFFSIDATESLYLLQNKIYSLLFPGQFREYFADPEGFMKMNFRDAVSGLYHLPTHRMQILPDAYFDLIICVQVLQEINEKALRFVLAQFKRVIKKNGFLYIRDNEFWAPMHKVRVARELLKDGWELVFKYTGREGVDIEGVPRLWVYTQGDNRKHFNLKSRIKKAFSSSLSLGLRGWKDYGLPI